jgi:CRISPR-associated protein Cmr2
MAMMRVHFALGPVQRFIGQARRTRDWWTGSFLLSYLAGQAMATMVEHGGQIIFPQLEDSEHNLLHVIQLRNQGQPIAQGPTAGSLPNRFQADVPDLAVVREAAEQIRRVWRHVAKQVWDRFVAPVADLGHDTAAIWQRQVENFWDISWIVSSAPNALDRRKNWRTASWTDEAGDKCTMMGTWQELSGYLRAYQRPQQDAFWDALRKQVRVPALRPDERLSAIALIKRLVPQVSCDAIGWELPRHYPSTVLVAAVPWVISVVQDHRDWAEQFVALATQLDGQPTGSGILQAEPEGDAQLLRRFDQLSGDACFPSQLDNDALWPDDPDTRRLRRQIQDLFRQMPAPRPFYALLLMDGDRLGASLQSDQAPAISRGLARFIAQVPPAVQRAHGATIYAGGDDVFALVPWHKALEVAVALRRAYSDALSPVNPDLTISAAIVYAHIHAPLTAVVNEAHRLLDQVAKEETGRNSLAVTVWKTHGPVLTWSAPWPAIDAARIEQLVHSLQTLETSNALLYKLRTDFQVVPDEPPPSESLVQALMTAEVRKTREHAPENVPVADWIAMAKKQRGQRAETMATVQSVGWSVDGLLWIRFLAGKGVRDDD